MGNKEKIDGVGIFVAEKWLDSVVGVERHSKRVMIVKLVLGERPVNVFSAYAPHSGKPDQEVPGIMRSRRWDVCHSMRWLWLLAI